MKDTRMEVNREDRTFGTSEESESDPVMKNEVRVKKENL